MPQLLSSISLLGKVTEKTVTSLNLDGDWYFIGYSADKYPIGSYFRIDSELFPVFLKLTRCFPDAMYELGSIPWGYKSICQFEFSEQLIVEEIECWSDFTTIIILNKVDIALLRDERIKNILDENN